MALGKGGAVLCANVAFWELSLIRLLWYSQRLDSPLQSIILRGPQSPLTRNGRDGSMLGTKSPLGVAPGCPASRRVSGGLSTNIRTGGSSEEGAGAS